MKLIYCIHSVYNPGGMERVLLNKVKYFVETLGWDVTVVTTDQHDRAPFYTFPEGVKMVDLGINYSDDNGKPFLGKLIGYFRRRKLHRNRFEVLLKQIKPDIVDCFYPGECSFIPGLKDGSKKVLELHQSKLFHHQYNRSGLLGLADKFRARMDERLVRKFDGFVVLTREDAQMWGEIANMKVIPNASSLIIDTPSNCSAKRVIAVGRLDYQKSFDRLIQAWGIVMKNRRFADWQLDIFGQGEWKDMLQTMIDERGMQHSVKINEPTQDIVNEYLKSSMLVMSSHYEGLPMVMIEAMACGLPVVSFDFKCGPKDIITSGETGYIVNDNDLNGLAEAVMTLMADDGLRMKMGKQAQRITEIYSEEKIMQKWHNLYEDLMRS